MQRVCALAALTVLFAGFARAESYVVLPFFNVSGDRSLNWIGESLAESVREALASEGLVALDRQDRAEVYRRLGIQPYMLLTQASVIKAADTLDAEHVVYGQFDLRPSPAGTAAGRGSIQISAHLLDLKRLQRGPDFGETGSLEDLSTLQRHLAWQTVKYVAAGTVPSETDWTAQHPAVRVDAMEHYIRGLLTTNPEEKLRLFGRAAHLDSRFSQPCFELGRLHWKSREYKLAIEWLQKVSSTDVHYREANFLLGLCRYYTSDFTGAAAAFSEVARTVPLNEVLNNLGAAQSRSNSQDALQSFEKAADGDPGDPAYQFNVGYVLWKRGDFVNAAERFRNVLDRDPRDVEATMMLGRCLNHTGPRRGDSHTEALERMKTNYEESAWWQLKAALLPQHP